MNATMSALEDGSLLATGDRPEIDEYRVSYRVVDGGPVAEKTARGFPAKITGLLVEALPHPALPMRGPGRGGLMAAARSLSARSS